MVQALVGIILGQQEQIGQQQKLIDAQQEEIHLLKEKVQGLKDEIARLKKLKTRPKIKHAHVTQPLLWEQLVD